MTADLIPYMNFVSNIITAFVLLVGYMKVKKVAVAVNGQFSEMKELIAKASKAEGKLEGIAEEKAHHQ